MLIRYGIVTDYGRGTAFRSPRAVRCGLNDTAAPAVCAVAGKTLQITVTSMRTRNRAERKHTPRISRESTLNSLITNVLQLNPRDSAAGGPLPSRSSAIPVDKISPNPVQGRRYPLVPVLTIITPSHRTPIDTVPGPVPSATGTARRFPGGLYRVTAAIPACRENPDVLTPLPVNLTRVKYTQCTARSSM